LHRLDDVFIKWWKPVESLAEWTSYMCILTTVLYMLPFCLIIWLAEDSSSVFV